MAFVGPLQVTSDHAEPVTLAGSSQVTVKVVAGDTVYWGDSLPVSSVANQGSIALNASQAFGEQVWVRSAGLSAVTITPVPAPQDINLGSDGLIGGPGGTGLTKSVASVGSVAPGSGNSGDYLIVRSDGTLARFKPPEINVNAWGVVGDARNVTVSITGTAITGTGFTALDNGKTISIAGAGAPVCTAALSSTLSIAAPITSLPVAALATPMPPGPITLTQGGNTQTFQTTTWTNAGATSIPVVALTPNFAYTAAATVASANTNLVTTVSYNSSTSLTASAAATTNQTGVAAMLGTPDTAAWQNALTAIFSAQVLAFPKPAGPTGFLSMVTSTLTLPTGAYVTIRGSSADTSIVYAGNGALFQNGSDDGQAYDSASDYSGPQGLRLEHLRLSAAPASTVLENANGSYSPGSIALVDWRGGDIQMDNVYISGFDMPFWGIESDLNVWTRVTINGAHQGMYVGPRSDQWKFYGCYWIFCDRAIDLDRVAGAKFDGCAFVDNGSATTNPVRIRSSWGVASRTIHFDTCWFEQLIGSNAVEAFIEVGVANGHVDAVQSYGVSVTHPHVEDNVSPSPHVSYLVKTGNADKIKITEPSGAGVVGGSLSGFLLHVGAGVVLFRLDAFATWTTSTTPASYVNSGAGSVSLAPIYASGGIFGGTGWNIPGGLEQLQYIHILGSQTGAGTSNAYAYIDSGSNKTATAGVLLRSAGSTRWAFGKSATVSQAETGSNVGSNLQLGAYDDTGALIGNVLWADRASALAVLRIWNINTTALTSAQIDAALPTGLTAADGMFIRDATNNLLLVRQGGKWNKTAALTQIA